jgi:fructose 1,6-bisphosphatase
MTMKVTVSVIEADTGSIGGHRAPSRQLLDPEGDRVIELAAPEELYDLAALLRDPERYVVESAWSRATAEQAAVVATSRVHNIGGTYRGKDDHPVCSRSGAGWAGTSSRWGAVHRRARPEVRGDGRREGGPPRGGP